MRKIIYIFLTILVCVLITTVIASANSSEKIVEDLICQRTDVLSLYYAGELNKKDTIEKIKEITTSHLRQSDIENLEKYFQCDLEQVRGYKIRDIKVTYSDKDVICANATIDWAAEGFKVADNFVHTYSIICEKEENLYKMAQFF